MEVDLVDRQTIEKKRFDRTFRHLLVIGNRWSSILGNIDVFRLIGTNSIDQRFEKRRIYAEWNLKVSYPMYIRFFRYRKDTFASFTRHQQFQKNHSRLFLNAIPSPLLGEPLSLSSSSSFFTKVPKTLQKRPVDHSSNVTRSRFIILKAASAPPKIKMRSPLVVEQHFNLAYVLSNPIYINPPPLGYCLHNPRLTVKFLAIRVFAPLSLVGLYTLSGIDRNSAKCYDPLSIKKVHNWTRRNFSPQSAFIALSRRI